MKHSTSNSLYKKRHSITDVQQVPRLNVLQTNQEYLASSVSNYKSRCLEMCTATLTWQHSTSLPWVVGNREVDSPTWQSTSVVSITYQRIFVNTPNHNVATCAILFRFVTFRFFLIPTTEMSIDRPLLCWHSGHSDGCDKTSLRHNIKCLP